MDAAAPQVTGEVAQLDCGSYRVCVAAAIDVRTHGLQLRVQCRYDKSAPEALEKYPTLPSACVHGITAAPPGPCFRMHATASGRPSAMNYPLYTSLQPCQLGVIGMRTMTARLTFLSNWWRQARGDLRFDGKSDPRQQEVAWSNLSGRGERRHSDRLIRASRMVPESHAPPGLTGPDRIGHMRPHQEKCSPGPVDHRRYLICGLRLS